ncbi:MAG: hypothetical protein OCD01_04085 [Fibrobacterales bacterium]
MYEINSRTSANGDEVNKEYWGECYHKEKKRLKAMGEEDKNDKETLA